jgi:hypothetical protein
MALPRTSRLARIYSTTNLRRFAFGQIACVAVTRRQAASSADCQVNKRKVPSLEGPFRIDGGIIHRRVGCPRGRLAKAMSRAWRRSGASPLILAGPPDAEAKHPLQRMRLNDSPQ